MPTLDDEQVLAVRAATAAWLEREAVARAMTLTLEGTHDPFNDRMPLALYLKDDAEKLFEMPGRYAPYPWAEEAALVDALAPWLGELPWGEKAMTWYAAPILRAAPDRRAAWCELRTPSADRWLALPSTPLPPRIAALQRAGDAGQLRDAVDEELPDADARTLAHVWLGANALLVPRSGLRFADGIPVAVDLYIKGDDAIDRDLPTPWSAAPQVRFLEGSRVERWPALERARVLVGPVTG